MSRGLRWETVSAICLYKPGKEGTYEIEIRCSASDGDMKSEMWMISGAEEKMRTLTGCDGQSRSLSG